MLKRVEILNKRESLLQKYVWSWTVQNTLGFSFDEL